MSMSGGDARRALRLDPGNLRRWVGTATLLALGLVQSGALASTMPAPGAYFESFPDTLSVEATCGNFPSLSVNGGQFSGNGCHIQVRNTSWGDGEASSFERDPAEAFQGRYGGLSPAARAAISGGQPYGVYEIELEMAAGSELVSYPSFLHPEYENEHGEGVEIELEIELGSHPRGLLFDSAAEQSIPALFRDPQTGTWDIFISTTSSDASQVGGDHEDGIHGIGFEAEFAWAMNGQVTDEFGSTRRHSSGEELEVEGIVVPAQLIPEPSSRLLLTMGLVALSLYARRRNSNSKFRQRVPA